VAASTSTPGFTLGLLEGDGIGPEIVPASVAVVDAALATADPPIGVTWVRLPMGFSAIETHGSPIPEETLAALGDTDGWLMGPHDSAAYPMPYKADLNPSGTVRKRFDLYANIRPAKTFPGSNAIAEGADLVIVRENSQGFYADRNTYKGTGEYMPTPDVAIVSGIFTRAAIERNARVACDLAMSRRKHLTIVHKANVLKMSTGLFRDVCREVAAEYPDLTVDDFHIDAMTVHLVRKAHFFDVIVTENMMGDILSDLAGELCGSLGVAPSLNIAANSAMAQAAHGSAPDIAGQNRSNPTAMILSSAMLLDWLGRRHALPAAVEAARRIETALAATIAAGTTTPDLGGTSSTSDFAAAIVSRLRLG
jgi:3-isopropylmalate dehydrogenase